MLTFFKYWHIGRYVDDRRKSLMKDCNIILLWEAELVFKKVSFPKLASPITFWTFLGSRNFWEKWKSTDAAQFLTASLRVGRISNILVEFNFPSNFKWVSHIDAKLYFGHFQSKNVFEV